MLWLRGLLSFDVLFLIRVILVVFFIDLFSVLLRLSFRKVLEDLFVFFGLELCLLGVNQI